jgi:ferritin-like metal-binding protein YciE
MIRTPVCGVRAGRRFSIECRFDVRRTALIAGVQKVEHSEIASSNEAAALSRVLGCGRRGAD